MIASSMFRCQPRKSGYANHVTRDFFPRFLIIFFNPKNFLSGLLQLLFVKFFLYFVSIIIRYLIRWRIGILNLCYSKNLFSPSERVTFFKVFLFLRYSYFITI